MWIAIGLIVLLVLFAGFLPGAGRLTDAMRASTPVGVYLNARKKGASEHDAIFDAIQVLRYRQPWKGLSDQELSDAANILATLHTPSLFGQIVAEVERRRDVSPFRDLNHLRSFVAFANDRAK